MKQTSLSEFRKSLLETGSYESSPEVLAPVPRPQGRWTTFSFSWSVFFVFPFCAVREFFRALTTERWAQCCFKTVQKSEKFGIKVTADGWESRNAYKGPVVYLCNHMSTLETIMLPPVLLTYGPFNVSKSYIQRNWVSVEEYEDLKRMHKVYHDELEGNGFLDDLMSEVAKLDKKVL